jgi:hypothetical protein
MFIVAIYFINKLEVFPILTCVVVLVSSFVVLGSHE